MATYRAKVTSKGQITVPVQVRRALDLKTGDELTFDVSRDGVRVSPSRTTGRFATVLGQWRRGTGADPQETDQWLRELRGHEAP